MSSQPKVILHSPNQDALIRSREILKEHFLADQRPWVVAYSGGKDSTLVLQLVYDLLVQTDPGSRKPVHVVASDTRVEAPNIASYLSERLDLVEKDAKERELPLSVHLVRPTPQESFWGNLIGKGYPSPTRWFRWCTTKMKIKPSRRAIDNIACEHGSVVLLLGTRWDESSDRGKRMQARETNVRGLNPHHEIPNALVLAPVAHWTTDEVWEYLYTNNPPPWGGSHNFMLDLYRQASGGECPVVLDLNTPSCGGSRFGCWTCTVVKVDKSMQGFIESGETWMTPLKEYRDRLKQWREDPMLRLDRRRDGSKGPGPFTPEARMMLLQELLKMEHSMIRDAPNRSDRELISDEEIAYIQNLWNQDFDHSDSALRIAREYARNIDVMSHPTTFNDDDRQLIQKLVGEFELQEAWVDALFYLVHEKYPSLEAPGVKPKLLADIKGVIQNAVDQASIVDSTP